MAHFMWHKFTCLFLLFASLAAFGADSKRVPAAPIPVQIQTAKRIFIANSGDDFRFEYLGKNRAYDQFYAGLMGLRQFELASSPSEADLVYEIGLVGEVQEYGQPKLIPVLRLRILDPKTQTVLWSFTENLEKSGIVGMHQDSKFDKAMDRLMKDVQQLVQPPVKAN